MIGLTDQQIKQLVTNWGRETFYVNSNLYNAINSPDETVRLQKTIDELIYKSLPNLLSSVITANNEAIKEQLKK